MRSHNRKVNSIGKAGCVGLLALSLALISPVSRSSAFAEEADKAKDTGVPAPQAEIPSTMSISFSPTSGSASLSPTTSIGQSAQIKVLATVNVQKSGGYSVYVKSNSQNLVGVKDSENVIPGMQGSSTYANLPVNSWGYYATEGSVVPDNATYKAVSTTGNGDKIAENTSNKITSDTKTIALSFATKVNDEKPADTYQNTVTVSVVSSPWAIAEDFGIGNMQEMTSTVCENAKDNDDDGVISGQLKDVRDGKYYWVTKLADGKCWMTQNLDLDLDGSTLPLTPATSDVKNDWKPMKDGEVLYTATIADANTIVPGSTGQGSWNLGDVRITNPDASSDCGYPKISVANCASQFTAHTTPTSQDGDELAHYILGNHYQWNAATAGTGSSITSDQATNSICPANWRLPTSGSDGELATLIDKLGGTSSTNDVTKAPFYGVRGGNVNQDTTSLFRGAGAGGYYWSSTPYSNADNAYYLDFWGTDNVLPSGSRSRSNGFSVRCVAKQS